MDSVVAAVQLCHELMLTVFSLFSFIRRRIIVCVFAVPILILYAVSTAGGKRNAWLHYVH